MGWFRFFLGYLAGDSLDFWLRNAIRTVSSRIACRSCATEIGTSIGRSWLWYANGRAFQSWNRRSVFLKGRIQRMDRFISSWRTDSVLLLSFWIWMSNKTASSITTQMSSDLVRCTGSRAYNTLVWGASTVPPTAMTKTTATRQGRAPRDLFRHFFLTIFFLFVFF